jgi:CMP-N,N'-diacetyllegionaminic acid synthase
VSLQDITAVVPIRKGSERIPGKNLADFATADGKTYNLLEWKLSQLLQVLPAENILVSSDWDEALEIATNLGVSTVQQPSELCKTHTQFSDVVAFCASQIKTSEIAWTPVTSPLIGPTIIKSFFELYSTLSLREQSEGLIVTRELASYAFLDGIPINFALGKGHKSTQELPRIEIWDWALSLRKTEAVMGNSYMIGHKPRIVSQETWATIDINDLIDLETARLLLPLYARAEGVNVVSARALNESE